MRALRCRARYKLQKSGNLRARSDAGLKQRLSGIGGHAADGRARTQLAVGPTLHRPEKERTVSPDRSSHGPANLVLNPEGCPTAATGKRTAKPLIRHSGTLVQIAARVQRIVVVEPECRTMEVIRPAFGDQVHHRSRRLAVFGRELVRDQSEFLN